MGGDTTPKSHRQISCSHYLEWTRQHATQNTRSRKLTTVHPYRFWPRPLVPIVVLATIEALQAITPYVFCGSRTTHMLCVRIVSLDLLTIQDGSPGIQSPITAEESGQDHNIITLTNGRGHDPKITHCCDKRFIRIRREPFAPFPRRFLQVETPWRRCSGLTLLNYNNIIPKQGGNYPALVFAEENRGVVSCFNPSYPDTLFCCRLHPTWSNSF